MVRVIPSDGPLDDAIARSPLKRQDVTALVLGAGLGVRMRMGPKAFVRLKDVTLLEMAVRAVVPFAAEIVVGVCPDSEEHARELLRPLTLSGPHPFNL